MTMALASLRIDALRSEERAGLAVAVGLHLALLAALILRPDPAPTPVPDRMVVSLADDVGLESEAPQLVAESQAAAAPSLAEEQVEAIEAPKPVPRVDEKPRIEKPKPTDKPRKTNKLRSNTRKPDNFDKAFAGAGSSTATNETRIPASQIGASAKASLVQALSRQLAKHWSPPSGPEVDKITSFLKFRLNPDGTLAGRPELVRQTGVNDTNRTQAARHAEQAIRAVQLAAPFDMPAEYYNAWKLVGPFGFDWELAQ